MSSRDDLQAAAMGAEPSAPERNARQTITLTVHRFDGLADRAWAFAQMARARAPLARLPGLQFYRLFGSGSDDGFNPTPNLGVYAVLASFETPEAAAASADAPVFARYRAHASERLSLTMRPIRSFGRWGGVEPFAAPAQPTEPHDERAPIAVLTRASVKLSRVAAFWSRVPGIRAALADGPRPEFQIGMGERPWVNQVTFSVWRDYADARAFAYGDGPHRAAIERVRAENWFSEELYARFRILGVDGAWGGRRLLENGATDNEESADEAADAL